MIKFPLKIFWNMTRHFIFLILLLIPFKADAQEGLVRTYYPNGQVESEINYVRNVREGEAKFYYENGNLKEERIYVNGKVEGLVNIYYDNGNLREMFLIEEGKREGPTTLFNEDGTYLTEIFYTAGKLYIETPVYEEPVKTEVAATNGEPVEEVKQPKREVTPKKTTDTSLPPAPVNDHAESDPAYYLTAEIMPEIVGGMGNLYKRLAYPEEARKKKIQGVVNVMAFIDENGDVTKAEVVDGIGYGCDEAAQTAVYYSRFKPGLIRGRPVKVQMIVPVEFKLF